MDSKYNELLKSSFKSNDTEEWLDVHFTRPVGLWWALFFNKLHVHPNVVTIISMFLVVAAGLMFYYPDVAHNVIGVLLLMLANFYDSADGQLARLTNQKTQIGRLLDGLSGDVWFFTTYACVCLRVMPTCIPFTNIVWGLWIWVLAFVAGILCHTNQSALADYYRNIHLFFLNGKNGSEFDNSRQQREILHNTPLKGNFWKCAFTWGYARYCSKQERQTPQFQRFIKEVSSRYGKKIEDIPQDMRKEFLDGSLPLMKYTNILTFNVRAICIYISCVINIPWLYMLVEILILGYLHLRMHRRHEILCKNMCKKYFEK